MSDDKFAPVTPGVIRMLTASMFQQWLNDIYSFNLEENGKIKYVPGINGPFFCFWRLYDFAVDTMKIAISLPEEDKKMLWEFAKQRAIKEYSRGKITKEKVKQQRDKYYKSEVIYKYLVDKYNQTGTKMEITWDDDGSGVIPFDNLIFHQ